MDIVRWSARRHHEDRARRAWRKRIAAIRFSTAYLSHLSATGEDGHDGVQHCACEVAARLREAFDAVDARLAADIAAFVEADNG